ncbi:MAG TPA: DUF4276 family protein [Desulfobacterales bacterium]|nr:MAG: hypothetical protein DRI57_17645 [Deltaproteobacteria bacterium]HHC24661.1 DUF4276 family protein [Desulfobacterales bacterium]
MPCIIPIVEGQGERDAVPLLLRRILHQHQLWHWSAARPIAAGNLNKLKKKLGQFVTYAQKKKDCGGILILLDLDDGCPAEEAADLAEQVRSLYLRSPVAIVFAHREYEAWFLASMEVIARNNADRFPANLKYEGDVEGRRGVKEWLTHQMPPGQKYKPAVDQAGFTNLIDIDLARQRSRSFRRLYHAVQKLVQMSDNSPIVSP